MTGHWEFTYGAERVQELVGGLGYPFLAQNVRDTEFEDPVFESTAYYERGGVKVAVIGQAFPYTPIANPRWMIPDWSLRHPRGRRRRPRSTRRAAKGRSWSCCCRTTASTSTASWPAA